MRVLSLVGQLASLTAVVCAVSEVERRQGLPLVDSISLQEGITVEALQRHSQILEDIAYATEDRNRFIGTPGHVGTGDYVVAQLEALGGYYDISIQNFTVLAQTEGNGNLSVNGVDQAAALYEYSPGGNITASIIPVANLGCEAADYPTTVEGNIALISRGECEFGFKSALAGAAGAAAAIIYNNVPGEISSGTLGPPPRPEGDYVPTVQVTQASGTTILDSATAGGNVTGTISAYSVILNITTFNVFAETVGGDKDNVLVLGGHSDSVEAGPGINDDGSGIMGILETAIQLSNYSTNNAVRFAFWGAEEEGLLGSTYYVQDLNSTAAGRAELAKIKLYLNFDMIASPNYIFGIYDGDGSAFNSSGPDGSAEAEYFFETFFNGAARNFTTTEFTGRSDYGPFLDIGIASGGLFTGAELNKTVAQVEIFGGVAGLALDENYHQVGDNYTNMNWDAFEVNTKAVAASVATYSFSFQSLHQNGTDPAAVPGRKAKRDVVRRAPGVDALGRSLEARSLGRRATPWDEMLDRHSLGKRAAIPRSRNFMCGSASYKL